MTEPRKLGNVAERVLEKIEGGLVDNQQMLFEILTSIYADDKAAAVAALKQVSRNNLLAARVITLLRAGDIAAAEDLIIDSVLKREERR